MHLGAQATSGNRPPQDYTVEAGFCLGLE